MSTPQPQAATERPTWNLDSPDLYLNRELTWLAFNRRVLNEAEDERTPLLERVKFIAIVSANLDEFFMKRVGGLKQQRGAGVSSLTVDGRTPEQQIAESNRVVRELEGRVTTALDAVLAKLEAHDIRIVDYATLSQGERTFLREHFFDNIFPLMTPQAIDPAHPFPFVSNLSFNLLVKVRLPGELGRISLARIKVPVGGDVPRFLKLHDVNHFVLLEQVVINNMDMLLPGVEVLSCEMFRVTRNANTERAEEQADDLLVMIESELRDRRFAPIVRLQVRPAWTRCTAACWRRSWRSTRTRTCSTARTAPCWRRGTSSRSRSCRSPSCTTRRISPSTTRSSPTSGTSSTSSATAARCCCSTPTSPSSPRSSASCARRARTPRSTRSR